MDKMEERKRERRRGEREVGQRAGAERERGGLVVTDREKEAQTEID